MLGRIFGGLFVALVVGFIAWFILGLVGVGEPWPQLLGLFAGAAYVFTDSRAQFWR